MEKILVRQETKSIKREINNSPARRKKGEGIFVEYVKRENDTKQTKPRLLYKYRALNDKKSLLHLLDIIDNDRIYLSDHDKVNDPLEGA